MNKVYIVLVRKFFNNNGCDYAMAVDTLRDINIFTSKRKALEFHNELVEKCKNIYKADSKDANGNVFCESFFLKIDEITYDSTRIYISTSEKIINH